MANSEINKILMEMCVDIIKVNIPGKCLMKYIGQINDFFQTKNSNFSFVDSILNSIIHLLSCETQQEIFAFVEKSGIKLKPKDSQFSKGYCFCCSIFIERQSKEKEMTIFRLYSANKSELMLYIKDGYLNYTVYLSI